MARPPHRFHEFIGQKQKVDQLRRLLAGAIQRKEPFPHSIVIGPSGVGKTKLAKALAEEFGAKSNVRYGDISAAELVGEFRKVQQFDFFVIDEAHGLSREAQEVMFQVIDDCIVPRLERDVSAKRNGDAKFDAVNRCTIVLATDQPGRLQKAMRRRMALEVQLDFYQINELTEIVEKICSERNILISPQAAKSIAIISRGVPGTAKEHVGKLRLWYPQAEATQLTKPDIDKYCAEFQIDEWGLISRDRDYLGFLRDTKQASVESLALKLGTDVAEVRRFVEPYLARLGFVQIARGGRQLTVRGREYIDSIS